MSTRTREADVVDESPQYLEALRTLIEALQEDEVTRAAVRKMAIKLQWRLKGPLTDFLDTVGL